MAQPEITLNPEDIFKPNLGAEISNTRTWVDPNGYRLSDRLWSAKSSDRRTIDRILQGGLANGHSPLKTARELEQYLNPRYAPVRGDTGRIKPLTSPKQTAKELSRKPRQGPGVGPARPRNSGLGSHAARRLARTETSQAFGDAQKKMANGNPLLERMKWRKSAHHHEPDQCDQNASRSSKNCPPGVYFVNELPMYVDHPNEMCTLGWYVTNADVEFAIPRLREYIRTGALPDRDWGVLAVAEKRHIPLFDTVPKTATGAAIPDDDRPPGMTDEQWAKFKEFMAQPVAPIAPRDIREVLTTDLIRSQAVLDDIARVHKVPGNLTATRVREGTYSELQSDHGMYRSGLNSYGDAVPIDMLQNTSSNKYELTLAHETGHYLDQLAFGRRPNGVMASADPTSELAPLMRAIDNSQSVQDLAALRGQKRIYFRDPKWGDSSRKIDDSYIDYVLEPEEKFARAYAQYVGKKAGNAEIAQQIDNTFMGKDEFTGYQIQWTDEDFTPIMQEFDGLFERMGLSNG